MSNKFYSYEVNYLMENSLPPSLNILLEEDEDKKEEEDKKEDESFGDENIFGDEKSSDSDSSEGGEEVEGAEEVEGGEGVEAGDTSGGEGDEGSEALNTKLTNVGNLADQIEDVSNYLKSVTDKSDDIFQVQDFLSNDIYSKMSDSYSSKEKISSDSQLNLENKYSLNKKNKISYFLNEKISIKDIEDDIEAVDNIIDKGSELIDKFKKGTKLNIQQYVESSINAYRNFDNLFAKESIVKQAAMNLIILNSGARAEENIREFEELFHEELHKQFGIEYEEHAVITKPHHVATGAVKQG